MAVTAHLYGTPIKNQYNGAAVVDADTDTLKCALATNLYTPDLDAHDFFNDVTNEVTGTGYTAGGVTLASVTVTYDAPTNEMRVDANDAQWTTSTFTARYGIVYKSTGTGSTSPLLSYVDFGADVSVTAGTFTITWDATGIFKFTVA